MSMMPRPSSHDHASHGGGSHEQTWDAVETYFECITRCVDQLRDNDDA